MNAEQGRLRLVDYERCYLILNLTLDETAHISGTVFFRKGFFSNICQHLVGIGKPRSLFIHMRRELREHNISDLLKILLVKMAEDNYLIYAIYKLGAQEGRERLLGFFL